MHPPRPIYETAADRTREMAVVERVAATHGLAAVKMKPLYPADFGLMKDSRLLGVAEVKVRERMCPTMMLSLQKCQSLRGLAAWGLKARILYALPEGIYAQPITAELSIGPGGKFELKDDGYGGGYIGMGGRTDRGDVSDIEPCVFFDTARMRRICDSDPQWFKEMA